MKLLHLAMGFAISAALFVLPAYADNVCTDSMIDGNQHAQEVCKAVCFKQGRKTFTGAWSNGRNHPSVKACIASSKGIAVCDCKVTPAAAAPATPDIEKPKASASSASATPKLDPAVAKACSDASEHLKEFQQQMSTYSKTPRANRERRTTEFWEDQTFKTIRDKYNAAWVLCGDRKLPNYHLRD